MTLTTVSEVFKKIGLGLLAATLFLPIASILIFSIFQGSESSTFSHLLDTVLSEYLLNSLFLVIGVGLSTLIFGGLLGWLVTFYDFPLRDFLRKYLVLPLALPKYILALIYFELLDYSGPIQKGLRELFQFSTKAEYWFPEISSLGGTIFVLTLALFPYVFLLARESMEQQASQFLDVARNLGKTPAQIFRQVIFPLARPSLFVGLGLVCMETLADFGVSHFLGIPTLTTGIYTVWLGMHDIGGASQLSLILFGFILFLVFSEKLAQKNKKIFQIQGKKCGSNNRTKLTGARGVVATLFALTPFVLGVLVPIVTLVYWTSETWNWDQIQRFGLDLYHSSLLGFGASFFCLVLGLILTFMHKGPKSILSKILYKVTSLGYGIPGPLLALGILIPLSKIDQWGKGILEFFVPSLTFNFILTNSLVGLILAYCIRFLALSFGPLEAGLKRIPPEMGKVAKLMGHSNFSILKKLYLPLLKGPMFTAFTFIFVDILKELPATLMLRPFNFSTLSTRIFEYASDEMVQETGPWGLTLFLLGLFPILILGKNLAEGPKKSNEKEEEI